MTVGKLLSHSDLSFCISEMGINKAYPPHWAVGSGVAGQAGFKPHLWDLPESRTPALYLGVQLPSPPPIAIKP